MINGSLNIHGNRVLDTSCTVLADSRILSTFITFFPFEISVFFFFGFVWYWVLEYLVAIFFTITICTRSLVAECYGIAIRIAITIIKATLVISVGGIPPIVFPTLCDSFDSPVVNIVSPLEACARVLSGTQPAVWLCIALRTALHEVAATRCLTLQDCVQE